MVLIPKETVWVSLCSYFQLLSLQWLKLLCNLYKNTYYLLWSFSSIICCCITASSFCHSPRNHWFLILPCFPSFLGLAFNHSHPQLICGINLSDFAFKILSLKLQPLMTVLSFVLHLACTLFAFITNEGPVPSHSFSLTLPTPSWPNVNNAVKCQCRRLVQAIVVSHLNHCNSLPTGLPVFTLFPNSIFSAQQPGPFKHALSCYFCVQNGPPTALRLNAEVPTVS